MTNKHSVVTFLLQAVGYRWFRRRYAVRLVDKRLVALLRQRCERRAIFWRHTIEI